LGLMDQYPNLIRQLTGVLKEQYRRKIILPEPALKNSKDYLNQLVKPPKNSFMYVETRRLKKAGISSKAIRKFQNRVERIIHAAVNPALKELIEFATGDYMTNAPHKVGLWQYPGGKDYYRELVKFHTSLSITPEEVHRIGLEQIDILNKELDRLRKKVHFKGDIEAFRRFLKSDPRFVPQSPE
ncbi:MAG: DUF885 domain-containing protein, partial [bacterium]|nr:DUF885 domain-containing protein [bacterium]